MKKKILGMFVCMLMIATTVSAVTSVKDYATNATVPNTFLTSTAGGWILGQKLLASDGAVNDYFGCSVSLSGDTALIGEPLDDDNGADSGSAYVFTRTGTTWTQQAKLFASDGVAGDEFGYSVSLDGNTALIGAPLASPNRPGAAYVFTRSGNTWTLQQKLQMSDSPSASHFGCSVSVDDNTALIGANMTPLGGNRPGAAYVFTRSGNTWTQQQELRPPGEEFQWDYFGNAVALDSDTALIGEYMDDTDVNGVDSGSAFVFTRTGTTWTQQQKLFASGGEEGDEFGCSVSLDGNTALIGAPYANPNQPGAAYVFTRTGTTWTQQQKLASQSASGSHFGCSVSVNSDTSLIGANMAPWDPNRPGAAYVYTRSGTTWTQQQELRAPYEEYQWDYFGNAVALDGDTALIGEYMDDDNGVDSGSAFVFTKVTVPVLDLINIKGGVLGFSVALMNFGEGTADNIYWEMNASEGLFYPKLKNGTIDVLYPDQSETIPIRPVLGLGKTTITFSCKYKIVNLSYNVAFEVKQEWRNLALVFLDSFPKSIQPEKEWMVVENYTYFGNRTETPGVELNYAGINNMHNVRVVLGLPRYFQEIEFLAACKFTDGKAILHECWITKWLVMSGDAHWEVELVDGG